MATANQQLASQLVRFSNQIPVTATPQGWRMLQHLPPRDGRLKRFGVRLAHRNHGVAQV